MTDDPSAARVHRAGRARTAAVFGGNSDIAIAIVRALAADGLEHAVLAVRDPVSAPGAEALQRERGLRVTTTAFDADDTESHPQAVDKAFDALADNGLDVAIVAFARLGNEDAKHDPAAAVRLAHTNFTGAVSVLTILGERLAKQRHGAIVVLSSVAGERARQANYPCGATKAGLDAFAQGLGDALAPTGVHVLVARPGFVPTKMTAGRPRAPMSTDADTVARDIVGALAKQRHTVWSPGVLRYVFAVVRHLPRPLWRRVRN